MTNAELIAALRNCSSPTVGSCTDCPYYKGVSCKWQMMEDAADAIEKLQSDWEYCSDLLNIAIRTTGISMTALVKLYEIECAEGERKDDE